MKLPLNPCVVDEFYAKSLWNHGQSTKAPRAPAVGVVVWFFQCAKVTESPRHAIPVALIEAVTLHTGTENLRNVLRHTWFLSNANYHYFPQKNILSSKKTFTARLLPELPLSLQHRPACVRAAKGYSPFRFASFHKASISPRVISLSDFPAFLASAST